jgi:dTDP-4-dehydrorhamnose 3,5-epimerase
MDQSQLLIVGANGQLATALREKFPQARAMSSSELNIADARAVTNFDWSGVAVILNAAAYTNVDEAQSPEGRVAAWQVNAVGARNLATVALQHNLALFHISSETVFDGTQSPHSESEPFSPLGVYAQTKAAGDIAVSMLPNHYILRTSWVVGEGKNFVRTMFGIGQKGISPTIVSDQIGRLTFTSELVRVIEHFLATKPAFGTYNVTNSGESVSWANITREIYRLAGFDLTVTDITTAEYYADKPQAAPRPLQDALDLAKLQTTGFTPRDWREDLEKYVAALNSTKPSNNDRSQ